MLLIQPLRRPRDLLMYRMWPAVVTTAVAAIMRGRAGRRRITHLLWDWIWWTLGVLWKFLEPSLPPVRASWGLGSLDRWVKSLYSHNSALFFHASTLITNHSCLYFNLHLIPTSKLSSIFWTLYIPHFIVSIIPISTKHGSHYISIFHLMNIGHSLFFDYTHYLRNRPHYYISYKLPARIIQPFGHCKWWLQREVYEHNRERYVLG